VSPASGVFAAVFLAAAVEAVEAATIVLATGVTRGWRGALSGAGAGLLALVAVVAALGPALAALPLDMLRLAIGALLLIFGLQWLRKAILRASGYRALRDENAVFTRELEAARIAAGTGGAIDAYGFTISFKAVLLEGLEVALIVVTLGGSQQEVPLAVAAAVAAVATVAAAAAIARAPLSHVPENTIKFAVGVLLTSFGVFWGGEGAGVSWPTGDAAILVLIVLTLLTSGGMIGLLRRRRRVTGRPATGAPEP
jgi:uncharacterized membrane protein